MPGTNPHESFARETIVLASASPRRRDLLALVKIPFLVIPPGVDESLPPEDGTGATAVAIAVRKAEAVAARLESGLRPWILAADTIVELEGRLLGKPAGREQAREFLSALAGRTHRVHTGLALLHPRPGGRSTGSSTTEVRFKPMTDVEIDFYLDTGEWNGVAGAYRIQEQGGFFVERVRGSYSNVVGLPLELLYLMLAETGYRFG